MPDGKGERGGRKTEKGSGTTETTHMMARAFKSEEKKTSKDVRDDPPAATAY